MIKIKNAQLNNDAISALNNLMEMDIKAGAAFKLMRIIKEISTLVEDKLKMEQKILEKYVETGIDGKATPVYDDNNKLVEGAVKIKDMKLFQSEMESLLTSETTLNVEPIAFEDLGLETIKLKDLLKIDFIFS
jgi:hypothetical protein